MKLLAKIREKQEDPQLNTMCEKYIEIAKQTSGFENAAAFEEAIEQGRLDTQFRNQLATWKELEELANRKKQSDKKMYFRC